MKLAPLVLLSHILTVCVVATGQQQQPQSRKIEPQLTPLSQLIELTARDGVLELNWANGVPHEARRIVTQGPEWRWLVEPAPRSADHSGVLITRASIGAKRPEQFIEISASSVSGTVALSANRAVQFAQ